MNAVLTGAGHSDGQRACSKEASRLAAHTVPSPSIALKSAIFCSAQELQHP